MFSKPKHPGCKCGTKYKKYILCCKILMTILFLQSLWAKKKKRLTKKKSNRTVMWNHKVGWKAIRNATGRNRFFIFFFLDKSQYVKGIYRWIFTTNSLFSHTYVLVHVPWSISYGFLKSLPGISNVQKELPWVWLKGLGD